VKTKKRVWEISSAVALFLVVLVCGSIGGWWLDRPRRLSEQLSNELKLVDESLGGGEDVSLKQSRRLRELVRQGARVETTSENGLTLLEAAASAGDLAFVKDLLSEGVAVDPPGRLGAALGAAARAGQLEVTEELLRNGATVKASVDESALMVATISGNPRVIRALVRAGAQVDAKDLIGRTALNWSVGYGHPEAVKALLDLGADPSIPDNQGKTPLANAEITRHRIKSRRPDLPLDRWTRSVQLLKQASRTTSAPSRGRR
jgi:ankyrin repeat protein